MIINLNNPLELPGHFIERLESIQKKCFEIVSTEALFADKDVNHLVKDINEYCLSNRIIGIHYTRAIRDDIVSKGLLIESGTKIRERFIRSHGNKFTPEELTHIVNTWKDYYDEIQCSARDWHISFNFTEKELCRSGSARLTGMYGGEQVHMCFEQNDAIGVKLSTIGQPMVIYCSLDPGFVTTYSENPWGGNISIILLLLNK